MNHDATLIIIISIIIAIQVIVFVKNISKINSYKKTIGNVKNFTIVNVNIHEDQVKDISIEEVLKNRIEEIYDSSNVDEMPNTILEEDEIEEDYYDEDLDSYNEELEFPEDEEEYEIDKN
jgi:hypothetical protein